MVLSLSCPRCGRHRAVEAKQADFGIRCTACPEFMDVERSRSLEWKLAPAPEEVCPWTPWQIVATSVVFGAGAGGAAAGVDFARLGRPQYLISSVVVGWVLFVVAAGLILFLVPDEATRLLCLAANLATGFGFMLVQKPFFDIWKMANWSPGPGNRYRPNGRGQLLLVCLASLGIEIGVITLLAYWGGTW